MIDQVGDTIHLSGKPVVITAVVKVLSYDSKGRELEYVAVNVKEPNAA